MVGNVYHHCKWTRIKCNVLFFLLRCVLHSIWAWARHAVFPVVCDPQEQTYDPFLCHDPPIQNDFCIYLIDDLFWTDVAVQDIGKTASKSWTLEGFVLCSLFAYEPWGSTNQIPCHLLLRETVSCLSCFSLLFFFPLSLLFQPSVSEWRGGVGSNSWPVSYAVIVYWFQRVQGVRG